MAEYLKRLLGACDRRTVFAAMVHLDRHRGSDTDHDARASFRMRKIRNEIVCLTETGMISAMHHSTPYNVILSEAKNL
jgi:hypothetical protein